MKRAAVSIDVDGLDCYRRIHGLPAQPGTDPVFDVALPRFFELLARHKLKATVFLIGSDEEAWKEAAQEARRAGHELASHSYAHDYGMSRKPKDWILDDLKRAEDALAPHTDRVLGFRAPGYNTTRALLECVIERGYRYDSSLLSAPAYWAARAAAIAWYQLRGRPSDSLVGRLDAFWGPRRAYRTDPATPWLPRKGGSLVELPMAGVPRWGVPLIGTSWVMMPAVLRRPLLKRAFAGHDPFVFEMHAVDLLGPEDAGVSDLLGAQRDLRVPIGDKLEAFDSLFAWMASQSAVATLCELATGV